MLKDADIYTTSSPEEIDRINGAFALVLYGCSAEDARAEKLVHCMQELYDNEDIPLQPTTTALNAMLNLWAKQGKVDLVSDLLHSMIEGQEKGRHEIAPNKGSFNSAVLVHAKRGDPKKARHFARLMFTRYQRKLLSELPNIVTLNGILEAWARSGRPDAGKRAEEVLQWMEKERVLPNTRSYNCIIDAYSKSHKGAHSAERILHQLMDMWEQGLSVGPDDYTFTAVVHAWANDSSPESAERASAIVKIMEDAQDSGYEGIVPLVSTYNALISAWAKSNDDRKVQKVKELLEYIQCRPGIVPNEITYSSVISTLVKSDERGVDEALEFLRELEDRMDSGDDSVKLSAACYNAVLSGLIRSKGKNPVLVAEQLLQRMLKREKEKGDANISPNTVTYNSIMNILFKTAADNFSSRAISAESMLTEMEDLYRSGKRHVKPSAVSYITCISAWARSNHRQKVPKAQAILRRMEEAYRDGNLDAKPNLLAYNALLNSCSFPVGAADKRFDSVQVVLDTLEELRDSDYGNPDDISYATALKAFGRCTPPGNIRYELVEQEFERCCSDGQVNDFVLRELEHACPEVYIKHFGNKNISDVMTSFPREWRRNVSSRRKPRGR